MRGTRSKWDPNNSSFGILSEIAGTLYTAFLALIGGGVLGITVALVTSQGFLSPRWELIFKNLIELLAAIPSVVYGLWGIFVLIPAIRPMLKDQRICFGSVALSSCGKRDSGPPAPEPAERR